MAQCILEVTLVVHGQDMAARRAVVRAMRDWHLEGKGARGNLIQYEINSCTQLHPKNEFQENKSWSQVLNQFREELDSIEKQDRDDQLRKFRMDPDHLELDDGEA